MSEPTFRPVQLEDIPSLVRFCADFPGDGRTIDFWMRRMRHWWIENPAMTDDWLLGYQLLIDNNLQGITLNIPIKVVIQGMPQQASLASTWRVMPRYRALSCPLVFEHNAQHNHLLRIDGTPTPGVLSLLNSLSFHCFRKQLATSQFACHPLAFALKALKRPITTRRLAKLILPPDAPDRKTLASDVDEAWQATCKAGTGPVRDWNYWQWFTLQNPSVSCSAAILPATPSAPALSALLVDYGDGKLQVADLWPSTARRQRICQLIDLILQEARRARFHSLVVPHWNSTIVSACEALQPYRLTRDGGAIWTNTIPLPPESEEHYWPYLTGDALL